jgi:ankyrin repeat protein
MVGEVPALNALEKRLRDAARVDRLLKPSLELYRELLDSGWDVNSVGEDHQNAVTSAVSAGDLESVRFLIEHGATVSREALRGSAVYGDPRIFRLLLTVTQTDMKSADAGELLVSAVRNTEIVRFLLDQRIDVNARGRSGDSTPLIFAVSSGSLDSAKLLLSRGAEVNATDRNGRTALWYAARTENTGFISALAQHGANVNAQDSKGHTALMNATDACRYWNVNALLGVGADPRIVDKSGHTARPSEALHGDPNCKTSLDLVEAAVRKMSGPQ